MIEPIAYFKFVKAITEGKPYEVYNFGKMKCDFSYINDVIEGVIRIMYKPTKALQTGLSVVVMYRQALFLLARTVQSS